MRSVAKFLLWGVMAVVVIFVTMVAAAFAAAKGVISLDHAYRFAILAVVAPRVVVGAWISIAWMRRLDEAAQEAHKSAWFWGGNAGIGIGFAIMAVAPHFGLDLGPETYDQVPVSPYYFGALMLMGFAVAGYGIAWALWWLKRR